MRSCGKPRVREVGYDPILVPLVPANAAWLTASTLSNAKFPAALQRCWPGLKSYLREVASLFAISPILFAGVSWRMRQ